MHTMLAFLQDYNEAQIDYKKRKCFPSLIFKNSFHSINDLEIFYHEPLFYHVNILYTISFHKSVNFKKIREAFVLEFTIQSILQGKLFNFVGVCFSEAFISRTPFAINCLIFHVFGCRSEKKK